MRLDELQEGLRTAAEAGPARDLGDARRAVARRVRRHQTRRLLAIATVAIALLGAGVFIARHRNDGGAHVVTGLDQVPRLVPSYVPDGLSVWEVIDLRGPSAGGGSGGPIESSVSLYATGADGDPVGGSSFAVEVVTFSGLARLGGPTPSVRTVTTGTAPEGFTTASMTIDARTSVGVLSRQLTPEQLTELAKSIVVGPDGSTVEHVDAPPGYRAVATDRPAGFGGIPGNGVMVNPQSTGYAAIWEAPGSSDDMAPGVLLTVTRGDTADLDLLRWGLLDPTFVEVDGHRAVLGSLPGSGTMQSTATGEVGTMTEGPRAWVLAWLRDDHTLVTVAISGGAGNRACKTSGGDCTPDTIQRIATSLAPADASAWQTFLAGTTTTTADPNCQFTDSSSQSCLFSGSDTIVVPPVEPPTTGG